MVIGRLKLQPASGRLAAVVALGRRQDILPESRREPSLNLQQTAEVIAGGSKSGLAQKLPGRKDFSFSNRRPDVYSRLEVLD